VHESVDKIDKIAGVSLFYTSALARSSVRSLLLSA
jgi:hypothetical protein